MKKNNKKAKRAAKAVLSLAVLSALFGNIVSAESATDKTNTGISQTGEIKFGFPDVAATHWASKYVTRMALEGVVQGDEKGKYNPDVSVSQQDAVIMAVRMAGLESEAKKIKPDSVIFAFGVREDAKPYVSVAIDKGLIELSEEIGKTQAEDKGWGAKSASREWIAKLVVRMVSKQDQAKALEKNPSVFTDNKDISSNALGYVNEAAVLKIVDGFEDGSFKPKANVTRAQMSAFFSRAEVSLPTLPAGVANGSVIQSDSGSLQLFADSGEITRYTLNSNLSVYKGTERINMSQIKANDRVQVIASGSTAYYVEVISDSTGQLYPTGMLESVNMEDMKVVVSIDGQSKTFLLTTGVTVMDQSGKGLSLAALEAGTIVEVRKGSASKDEKYSAIVIKEIPAAKPGQGTVTALNTTDNKLSVQDASGVITEYVLSANVGVAISTIHVGDTVQFQSKLKAIVSLQVFASEKGKLVDIKTEGMYRYLLILKTDGTYGTYPLINEIALTIPGKTAPLLTDLSSGDDVTLQLDGSKNVSKIIVNKSATKTNYLVTILNYDVDKKYMTVDNNGSPEVYKLTDKTEFESGGSIIPISSFPSLNIKGWNIDITAREDKTAVRIRVGNTYEGTLSMINAATGDILLKMPDNQTIAFKSTSSLKVENSSGSITINQLSVGDRVQITCDTYNKTAQKITIKPSN